MIKEVQPPIHSIGDLPRVVGSPNWQGSEKIAYLSQSGQLVKIYKTTELEDDENQACLAQSEYEDYLTIGNTPLGVYVPRPLGVVCDLKGNIIGLAITPHGGEYLFNIPSQVRRGLLTALQINELEARFRQTIDRGVVVDPDMFNITNLALKRNDVSRPQLYFNECRLYNGNTCNQKWTVRYARHNLNEIRRLYI